MIFDWFHRKFIEKIVDSENSQFRYPVIDKPELWSEQKEHRFRYFIPPINSSTNIINPGVAIGKQDNSYSKEKETKTENPTFPRTSYPEMSKPEFLSRIKKFYIVTSNQKTDVEVLKLSAAFIKGVYSPNIRKFLVVPLPEDNTSESNISHSNSDSDVPLSSQNQAKLDNENLSNVYRENDLFMDLDEYFDDLSEEKYIPSNKTENLRDALLKTPLEQHQDDGWRIFKHPTIKSPISERDTYFHGIERTTETKKLWRQSDVDSNWWCDLVDIELPVTCQNIRSKLKEPPVDQESKSALKLIFEKLFTKTPENYNEIEFYRRIID